MGRFRGTNKAWGKHQELAKSAVLVSQAQSISRRSRSRHLVRDWGSRKAATTTRGAGGHQEAREQTEAPQGNHDLPRQSDSQKPQEGDHCLTPTFQISYKWRLLVKLN